MEDLTKHQLILLALLVSFVTSIAASIATASLLDQAPPRVTQTIHRVVERTVETVVPSEDGKPDVVVKENTVIVREEDAITDAIANTSPSVVKLYLTQQAAQNDVDDATGPERSTRLRGVAVVVGGSGRLVTTSSLIVNDTQTTYEAVLRDGTEGIATLRERRSDLGSATFTLELSSVSSLPDAVVLAGNDSLRLGQTVIGLGDSVTIGIISNISKAQDGSVTGITTNITSDVAGMPIVNLFGEIVGFARSSGTGSFIPAENVTADS